MENDEKEYILDQLNYIAFLNIKGVNLPYTLSKDIAGMTLNNSLKLDKFKAYNLLTKKIEFVSYDIIEETTVYNNNDYEENKKVSLEIISEINSNVNSSSFEYMSKDNILKYYLKNEAYMDRTEYNIFKIIQKFKFTIKDTEIRTNKVNVNKNIIKVWNEIIETDAKNNLNALEELLKKADDDDREDIQDIINEYKKAINTVNINKCKKVSDIIDTYPPFLLPLPRDLNFIKNFLNDIDNQKLEE